METEGPFSLSRRLPGSPTSFIVSFSSSTPLQNFKSMLCSLLCLGTPLSALSFQSLESSLLKLVSQVLPSFCCEDSPSCSPDPTP